jgi:hypothetical protein
MRGLAKYLEKNSDNLQESRKIKADKNKFKQHLFEEYLKNTFNARTVRVREISISISSFPNSPLG